MTFKFRIIPDIRIDTKYVKLIWNEDLYYARLGKLYVTRDFTAWASSRKRVMWYGDNYEAQNFCNRIELLRVKNEYNLSWYYRLLFKLTRTRLGKFVIAVRSGRVSA